MRTRPILFRAEMVRAILDGRKTMTRRLIEPQPTEEQIAVWDRDQNAMDDFFQTGPFRLPYPLLWVKEAWKTGMPRSDYATWVTYLADGKERLCDGRLTGEWHARNRSSLFMPRWASRINLQVTDVRIEPVQRITEADAKAEGVIPVQIGFVDGRCGGKTSSLSYVEAFGELWDKLHPDHKWVSNPWVWVVTFRRHA